MSVASFIASQRAEHAIPHAKCCRFLGLSESWFYKWHDRPPPARWRRREELDGKVKEIFFKSGGTPRTYGAPPIHAELQEAGWAVAHNTVADSMGRQGARGPAQAALWVPDQARQGRSTTTS